MIFFIITSNLKPALSEILLWPHGPAEYVISILGQMSTHTLLDYNNNI